MFFFYYKNMSIFQFLQYSFLIKRTKNVDFSIKKKLCLLKILWVVGVFYFYLKFFALIFFKKIFLKKKGKILDKKEFLEILKSARKKLKYRSLIFFVEFLFQILFKSWFLKWFYFCIIKTFASTINYLLINIFLI
ncbi:hypothetical protein CMESO_39 (nucleomorph) [Chroomonas mesostigmatica CCMP1168]|uniref:Uncharacterized protein n=1 Tax=Chroomonas mesostigmatica CCMP1168 TaxID=1195612 RepID=J7G173_9CRYP|nr:hypothetical protein CMESO_39 [Chroomonas mesostigmatica CCMP1168]